MLCGGVGTIKPADEEIQKICDDMKQHAEVKLVKSFQEFKAINYATQVVNGTNYFVKVHVGGGEHVHLRIYKTLPYAGSNIELTAAQHPKTLEDELAHF